MRTRLDLLVICALALYRLWRFVARDAITERWREQLYNRWPPSAERAAGLMVWDSKIRQSVYRVRPERDIHNTGMRPVPRPNVSWLAKATDCPWCASVWLSAALTIAVDASFGLTWPVVWFGALCTLVGLLGRAEAS